MSNKEPEYAPYDEFDTQEINDKEYEEFLQDLKSVLNIKQGKRVIWQILSQCKIYNEVFHGNSRDAYDKGRRSVGLWLVAMMTDADPAAYPEMLKEVAKLQQLEEKRLAEKEKEND